MGFMMFNIMKLKHDVVLITCAISHGITLGGTSVMKKRVVYSLMTVMLLLLTIGQTMIPALASVNKSDDTSQLSSIINYQKALANTSSLAQVTAESQSASSSSASESSMASSASQQSSSAASSSQSTNSSSATTSSRKSSSVLQQTTTKKVTKVANTTTDPLQMGSLAVGKSTLMYMVGPKLANDNKFVPDYNNDYMQKVPGSSLVGRNNFNLQTPNNEGVSERWLSIHDDSEINDTTAPNTLSGASRLWIGSSVDKAVGSIPAGEGPKVANQTTLTLSGSGILTETLNYVYTIEGSPATFTDTVQFVPTEWGTVIVKEHVTNTSGRDLTGIFFGRTIDTDMRPFATDKQGFDSIGDKVPIKYVGEQRGLYEDQIIPANNTNSATTDGIPARYPGSGAHLSYNFDMQDGTGPKAWNAFAYEAATISSGRTFIGTAFKNSTTDLGLASKPGGTGESGAAGKNAFYGDDTEIAMMWLSQDMPAGSSRDLSYEVGLGGQGQYKLPEITLDQSPQVLFNGNDVQLTGTVTDADNAGKVEQLKYQVQHANGTTDAAKNLTTVTNTTAGTPNDYIGTADATVDNLALGDRITVWAVDADGNPSVNKEYTDLVAPAVTAKKQVKNVTTGETKYADNTIASVKDEVGYQATICDEKKATMALAKGAKLTDVLDKNLTAKAGMTQVEYFDASGTSLGVQTVDFDAQGQIVTDQDVPIGGHLVVTYTATVNSDSKDEIDNIISVTGGGLNGTTSSNTATVKLKKSAEISSLKQTVGQTKNGYGTTDEAEGGKDDLMGYLFTATVKADSGSTFDKSFTLKTEENASSHKDASGELDALYNDIYAVRYSTNGGTGWTNIDSKNITEANGKIQITVPGGLKIANGKTIQIYYRKKVKTAPDKDKFIYNDGSIGSVAANSTRIKAPSNTNITIRYVDLDEDLSKPTTAPTRIASEVHATGVIGSQLSTVVTDRVAPKLIDDYTILTVTEDSDLTRATWEAAYKDDPLFDKSDRVITYGYKKSMLSIEAPTSWNFGKFDTTQSDRTYYLDSKGKPQSVKVTDNYGVKNWALQVNQAHQFVDERRHELTGAQLKITNGNTKVISDTNPTGTNVINTSASDFTVNPGAKAQTVMALTKKGTFQETDTANDTSSKTNQYTQTGIGTWEYRFGDDQSADYSVGLHVPAATKRYVGKYQAELTWSLSVAP